MMRNIAQVKVLNKNSEGFCGMIFGRLVPRKPRLARGVEGHNQEDISFARFPLATTCPGKLFDKPFDKLKP
jgi:hypothetical protein